MSYEDEAFGGSQNVGQVSYGGPPTDTGSQGEGSGNTINANQFRLNGGPNSTVITRTKDQQERFQTGVDRMDRMRAFGGGDYRNSPQYAEYLSTTGRSVKNPYGSSGVSGILGKIFGEENISSTLDPAQAQKVLDVGFDRYMNFDQQSDLARSRGFGSLFSGAVGEQLANNQTVAEQVTPMSTSEMGARLGTAAVGLGPVLSLLPSTAGKNSNVNFISTGNKNYDPQLDPNVNPDLSSGIMGNIGKMLAGGVDLQEAGGRVMDLGRKGLDSLTERFGSDLNVPAGVMGPPSYTQIQRVNAGPGKSSVTAALDYPGVDRDTLAAGVIPRDQNQALLSDLSERPEITERFGANYLPDLASALAGRDYAADQITPFSPSSVDDRTRQEADFYRSLLRSQ